MWLRGWPSSWEGCGLWERRVDLNSSHWAGLGLGAHGTAACRSPRGWDSIRMPAGSPPGLVLCRHMPGVHDSGRWPASRATALHRDVRLCSAVRAGFAWACRALGRRTVLQRWFLTPGPSLPLQPPRFSTTSTCSTAPSRSSAQERRARRWPCATRESLTAPPQGLLSRVLAAAAPPVPVGTEPSRGGTRWYRVCWGVGCQPARGRWLSSLGPGYFHSTCLGGFPKTAARQEATGTFPLQLAARLQGGFS